MIIRTLILSGISLFSFAIWGKKDYLPDFKQAVVDSSFEKVESLLTRKNQLPKKDVNEVAAWADDLVEEKKVLQSTKLEIGVLGLAVPTFLVSTVYLIRYITNADYQRTKESPLQKKLTYAKLGAGYAATLLCGLYYLYMPRKRLADAYKTKFSVEKVCTNNFR